MIYLINKKMREIEDKDIIPNTLLCGEKEYKEIEKLGIFFNGKILGLNVVMNKNMKGIIVK